MQENTIEEKRSMRKERNKQKIQRRMKGEEIKLKKEKELDNAEAVKIEAR